MVVQSLSHARLFRDPMDCNPPASSVHGNCQARIREVDGHFLLQGSSQHMDGLPASCFAGGFLTGKPQGKPHISLFSSVQSLSRVRLCDSMNRSTPGLPVHHKLLEFTQTHVHRVSDAIQPSHPRSSPSPPAPNPSQHQSLFQ